MWHFPQANSVWIQTTSAGSTARLGKLTVLDRASEALPDLAVLGRSCCFWRALDVVGACRIKLFAACRSNVLSKRAFLFRSF